MADIIDFTGLKIKLASPEAIRSWSRGEVVKPETINYRTLKPEKDGLFSEQVFGPTKDWECYCGKYKRIRYRGIVCDKCGVEVTQSRVRRERMGHISLVAPVAHIWYFKGVPPKLSLLLDIPPKNLEAVIYFAQYLVTEVDQDKKRGALEKLQKELERQKSQLKLKLEKDIKAVEIEQSKDLKQVVKKVKIPDQRALAKEELVLKAKQKIQRQRDEAVLEEEKLDEVYRILSDLIKRINALSLLTEDEFLRLTEHGSGEFFKAGMGAEVFLEVIKKMNLQELSAFLAVQARESSGARHLKAAKRLRLVEGLRQGEIDPAWMIVKILPVIPPDLRPMVQLSGGRFATSDLNDLYRRVINRNNRLKHLMDLGAPEIILRNEKRMLQEAVDSLIDAAKRPIKRFRRRTQALRSLSDMLRGKQGRFRQNLLGKRVDYSGRSVIVVGPELRLSQCGLPKDMALEMFKPFVLREMILRGIAPNVKSAKNMFEHRPPEIYDILEEITKNHPVLLNRAPTLHKLGIQAFWPVLIEGNAIQIHPCVCKGYNADFDGDQMAVHIPLSAKAKEECEENMLSENNLLRPSDGEPIDIPDKEMALGCYFYTSVDPGAEAVKTIFADKQEAMMAYGVRKIELRQLIRVRLEEAVIETTVGRLLFNEILPEEIAFMNEPIKEAGVKALVIRAIQVCPKEKVVKLIDDLKRLGFVGSTFSGLSVGIWDCEVYPGKEAVIKKANEKVNEIEKNYTQGLVTEQEKRYLIQEIWMETTGELARLTWEQFAADNSVRLMVEAGLRRVSKEQVKQLSAMQGLVVDPLGRIVPLPTKTNFREGLSVFEYVTSARGSRKGLIDTAIKTSDAGYLTRRLVDVAHDVIIRGEDCATDEGITIARSGKRTEKFISRILGRVLAVDVVETKKKKVILKKGEVITEGNVKLLDEYKVNEVSVRSTLTCTLNYGVCVQCYGWDFSTKKMVEVGMPVGVIAAQSIGEPGTQLTLRTKHFGGIIVSDVTQGLPRVEELFEVRTPKALSPISEIAGKVEIAESEDGYRVKVRSVGIKPPVEREYLIPLVNKLKVKEGQLIEVGAQLATGSLDVRQIMMVKGLGAAQEYLIEEIQAVYESQGISINDRHFEVIVRKMGEKVRIETTGDSGLLPGELIDKPRFEEINARVVAEGGEPATATVVILGITRASLYTESWLSAASFEQTTNVLTNAALEAKEDRLLGLKENVIIGRLIPVTPERARLETL